MIIGFPSESPLSILMSNRMKYQHLGSERKGMIYASSDVLTKNTKTTLLSTVVLLIQKAGKQLDRSASYLLNIMVCVVHVYMC